MEEAVLLESILVSGLPIDLPPRVDSGRLFSVHPRRQVYTEPGRRLVDPVTAPLDRDTPGEEVARVAESLWTWISLGAGLPDGRLMYFFLLG